VPKVGDKHRIAAAGKVIPVTGTADESSQQGYDADRQQARDDDGAYDRTGVSLLVEAGDRD
jgi:hypothetical protein